MFYLIHHYLQIVVSYLNAQLVEAEPKVGIAQSAVLIAVYGGENGGHVAMQVLLIYHLQG